MLRARWGYRVLRGRVPNQASGRRQVRLCSSEASRREDVMEEKLGEKVTEGADPAGMSVSERRKLIRKEKMPLRAFFKGAGPTKSHGTTRQVVPELLEPLLGQTDGGNESIARDREAVTQRTYHVESMGCQMNFSDSEIVGAVLEGAGYQRSLSQENADVVLLNTCAIRENAEDRAIHKLRSMRKHRGAEQQIGVLGCMAERMKHRILEQGLVNVVAGPDAYRDLPNLLSVARGDEAAMNVQLSVDETYADIAPVRMGESWQAYISIMRGCNNMCSYCIVPFTRGRERSRAISSIIREVEQVSREGKAKDITLLGQNVNSYFDRSAGSKSEEDNYEVAEGFNDLYKARKGDGARFGELLDRVASVDPSIRIRFTSPHPKDFTDDVLHVIAKHDNICKGIHLPAQCGSDIVLDRMRRGYTKQAYLDLVARARSIIGPRLEISSDFISGFCGETEEDHQETLSLLREVRYTQAFMYAYSERERTRAYHKLKDDVPQDVKMRRLAEVVATFRDTARELAKEQIGLEHEVLIEGPSRRDPNIMQGKTAGIRRCVITDSSPTRCPPGTYHRVKVVDATQATLMCELVQG